MSWRLVGNVALALALLALTGAGLAAQAVPVVAAGSGGVLGLGVSSGGATVASPPVEPFGGGSGGGAGLGSGGAGPGTGGAGSGGAAPVADACLLDTDKELQQLDALCKSKCTGPDTLCLQADTGDLACEDAPASISAGTELKVLVLGVKGVGCIDSVEVTTFEHRRLDTLFEAEEPSGVPQGAVPGADDVAVVKELAVVASGDVTITSIGIRLTRTRDGKDPIRSTHLIEINHGRYFLRVGVLLPLVPDGRQEAVATPSPSDGEPTLSLTRDLYVMPALALNAFPFGGKSRGKIFCCGKRPLAELLGVQVGVGFDLSQPPPIFAGGILEPIAGFALSGGISFIQADVLNPDAAEGMLLRDPTALPVHREYIPRGYVGVTLSTEIIDTLLTARKGLVGKNVQ